MGIRLYEVNQFYINYLSQAEYRIIKLRQERILKNAEIVYRHKIKNGDSTLLARRCNDFMLLEDMCNKFVK